MKQAVHVLVSFPFILIGASFQKILISINSGYLNGVKLSPFERCFYSLASIAQKRRHGRRLDLRARASNLSRGAFIMLSWHPSPCHPSTPSQASPSTMARKTPHRIATLTAFYVVARRFNMRDVLARAERLRARLGIGKALMCTCAMASLPGARALHDDLVKDAQAGRHRFRTVHKR